MLVSRDTEKLFSAGVILIFMVFIDGGKNVITEKKKRPEKGRRRIVKSGIKREIKQKRKKH